MPSRLLLVAQMDAERAFVNGAAEEGRIVVHPTTCYGVRECGGSETFDQSCHWGTDSRYVCLRYAIQGCQRPMALHYYVSAPVLCCKTACACALCMRAVRCREQLSVWQAGRHPLAHA